MNDLPRGWVRAPVGVLATLNPKTDAPDETPSGFAPMQMLGMTYRGRLGHEPRAWGEIKKAYTHFRDGDVLLAKVTPCFENGKAGIASGLPSGIGAGSSEFYVLRPNSGVDCRYLLAYLSTVDFRRRATMAMTGAVGLRRVPRDFLISNELPVAPSAEQRRIADKLDSVLTRVDAVNTRLARVAPILKRFRQSVLAAATSGRLSECWRGGESPKWATQRAEDICAKVQSGGTPKSGFADEGVPFLKVYNIVNQQVSFNYKPQYVNTAIHTSELRKSQTQPGDVLMNIVGPPLGKVAIVPSEHPVWNINQAITLFRPSDQISSQWIYIVLCEGAPIREVLNRTKGSVGQVNISLSQCRSFEFPVPTKEEQAVIVRRVDTLFAFADRLEDRLNTAQFATDRLTPALLAKAFRGELVPQDPNDEPACELLQRLAASAAEPAAKRGRRQASATTT